jgi:hypothetical protein
MHVFAILCPWPLLPRDTPANCRHRSESIGQYNCLSDQIMHLALSKNSHVRSDRPKDLSDPAHSGLLNTSTGYQILEDPKSMFSYMVAMHHLKRQPVMFNP